VKQRVQDYLQLIKLNLSLLVLASCLVGYIIVPDLEVTWVKLAWLFAGGLLVTGAANASNQLLEKDSDKLMKRTKERPLPDARIGQVEAIIFIMITLTLGCYILFKQFNFLSSSLAFISYALYTFAYTPLKKISSIAVLVGAIPGSLPCLIGWAAGTDHIWSLAAWTLFLLQFFWQFPHFWAIAWLSHEEYQKAGMNLLPRGEKLGPYTAMQCLTYSAVLVPMAVLPMVVGLGGYIATVGCILAALWMCYNSYRFVKDHSDANARRVMFASFVYLPVVLIVLVIDKYI
jgi:protoheme IX farnesyltransferase